MARVPTLTANTAGWNAGRRAARTGQVAATMDLGDIRAHAGGQARACMVRMMAQRPRLTPAQGVKLFMSYYWAFLASAANEFDWVSFPE